MERGYDWEKQLVNRSDYGIQDCHDIQHANSSVDHIYRCRCLNLHRTRVEVEICDYGSDKVYGREQRINGQGFDLVEENIHNHRFEIRRLQYWKYD